VRVNYAHFDYVIPCNACCQPCFVYVSLP